MKNIIPLNNFLLEEALPLNLAKEYVKMGEKRNPQTTAKMDVIFNNKQRIYLPIVKKVKSTVEPQIKEFLETLGYGIKDYIQNLAFKLDNPKREIKIGKLLSQNKREDLRDLFLRDPIRELATQQAEYSVVISRHPYDIAGMSCGTGRESWHSSCLNIRRNDGSRGQNAHYVPAEIKNGTLTVYYIRTEDKNINAPLGRVNIKPYKKESELDQKDKQKCYFPDTRVYGSFPPDAILALKEWIISWQGDLTGDFYKWKGCYDYEGTAYHISVSNGMGIREIESQEGEYVDNDDFNDEDEECPEYDISDVRNQLPDVDTFFNYIRTNSYAYIIDDFSIESNNMGWDGCEISSDSYINFDVEDLVIDGLDPQTPFVNGRFSDYGLGMTAQVTSVTNLKLANYTHAGLKDYLLAGPGDLNILGWVAFVKLDIGNYYQADRLFTDTRSTWRSYNYPSFNFEPNEIIIRNCSLYTVINLLRMIYTVGYDEMELMDIKLYDIYELASGDLEDGHPDEHGYLDKVKDVLEKYQKDAPHLNITATQFGFGGGQ